MSTSPAAPGRRGAVGRLAGWALLALLFVMQFLNLRDGVTGHPARWSLFLLCFAVVALGTLPSLLRRGALSGRGRLVLGAFGALLAYALVSSLVTPLPRLTRPHLPVQRIDLVVPVVTAVVTMLAGWGVVAALGARRREVLWQASVLLAATTLLAGPRTILANHSLRLGTGMGGAAVYHVVLLLALGQLVAAVLRGEHRRLSLAGAVVCTLGIVLTGSRAGLICLVAFAIGLGVVLASRGRARLVAGLVGAFVVAVGVVMVALPQMRRLLQGHDAERTANYETALRAFSSSPEHVLLGVGSGRLWPWYPFESGTLPVPWKGVILSDEFGRATTNPHSVVLGVLAELGLVGMALLLVVVGVVLALFVRHWRAVAALPRQADGAAVNEALAGLVPVLALACSMLAFFFDYYLFKNYAISFWWWVVAAAALAPAEPARPAGGAAPRPAAGEVVR